MIFLSCYLAVAGETHFAGICGAVIWNCLVFNGKAIMSHYVASAEPNYHCEFKLQLVTEQMTRQSIELCKIVVMYSMLNPCSYSGFTLIPLSLWDISSSRLKMGCVENTCKWMVFHTLLARVFISLWVQCGGFWDFFCTDGNLILGPLYLTHAHILGLCIINTLCGGPPTNASNNVSWQWHRNTPYRKNDIKLKFSNSPLIQLLLFLC